MRRHSAQRLANLRPDAATLLAHEMARLRVLIAQRREAAKREGRIEETPRLRRLRWERLAAGYDPYQDIRERIEAMLSAEDQSKDDLMLGLGEDLLEAAQYGDEGTLQVFVEEGFPMTWQDPESGLTALHIVAACQARKALRLLLASDDLDFLLRDRQGRLASELAYLHGNDVAVARLLGIKERKQADAQGIRLTRRP